MKMIFGIPKFKLKLKLCQNHFLAKVIFEKSVRFLEFPKSWKFFKNYFREKIVLPRSRSAKLRIIEKL